MIKKIKTGSGHMREIYLDNSATTCAYECVVDVGCLPQMLRRFYLLRQGLSLNLQLDD